MSMEVIDVDDDSDSGGYDLPEPDRKVSGGGKHTTGKTTAKLGRSPRKNKSTATLQEEYESDEESYGTDGEGDRGYDRLTRVLKRMKSGDMERLSEVLEEHFTHAKRSRRKKK